MLSNCAVGDGSWKSWTARRSIQSMLKEVNPEYSLEGLMLKLQYFGHLMWRADSLENSLMPEDWEQEEKGVTEDKMIGWHHCLNGCEFEQTQEDGEEQGRLACCSSWGHKESDWTELLKYNNNNKITLTPVRGVCNFLGSVLSQQKFEVDQYYIPRMEQCYSSVLQLSYI